jgi:hypothetical protein
MPFQTSVLDNMAAGIPGELAFEGPLRATPAMLQSPAAANNVFGRAFTIQTVPTEAIEEGLRVRAGGTGAFVGILANPKAHVQSEGDYAVDPSLPNGVIADFVEMGYLFVKLLNASTPGQQVVYNTTTGELSAIAAGGTPGAGTALVPGATVYRYTGSITAPYDGLAVIRLTN